MLKQNIVNGYLLPVYLTYEKVFSQFILNQQGEEHLDAFKIDWVVVLVRLVFIFAIFEVWLQISKFSKDSLAQ